MHPTLNIAIRAANAAGDIIYRYLEHVDQLMVSSAIDGEQGCDLAMELLPNIVLLDISLPKKDGFEVLKFLRQHEETKAIPVIAVTASAMTHDKHLIFEAGFDEFVAKPIDQEELINKIFQLL